MINTLMVALKALTIRKEAIKIRQKKKEEKRGEERVDE